MKLSFQAEEQKNLTLQGARVYYEKGEHKLIVKIIGGADAREFELYPGQGFVCNSGERFYGLDIKNTGDAQEVEVEISDREKFDNRATIASTGDALPVEVVAGAIDLNGLLQLVNNGGSSRALSVVLVAAGAKVQLLGVDTDRLKAALNFSADCFLGLDNTVSAATGYPVAAGTDWVEENTAALWVYSAGVNSVRIFQDLK
jgi:hypothetical protein